MEGAPSGKDLGRAIASLRGERAQAQVARRAGIDRTSWSLYEAGKRRPGERSLAKILKGLGSTRLELEEIAWEYRRHRLLGEGDRTSKADARRSAAGALHPPPDPPPGSAEDVAGPVREEVRNSLARIAAAIEDLVLLVVRSRLS